jgi:SAM-dependent methyltransferase
MSVFDNIGSKKIIEFSEKLKTLNHVVPVECIHQHLRYAKGNIECTPLQYLTDRWYNSLSTNVPAYDVYADQLYLAEVFVCWQLYSRDYILRLKKSNIFTLASIQVVVDLGCGIGYSTAALKEIFPDATVIGTNLCDTIQYKFAKSISKEYDFKLTSNLSTISNVDIIFASEYFEHFECPIDHLKDVLKLNPKYLIIANAFGPKAIGHFDFYKINGISVDAKTTGKMFNRYLKDVGYSKMKTGFWNNRPAIYERVENKLGEFEC